MTNAYVYHVVPIDDLREHSCDVGDFGPCWCEPRIEYEGAFEIHVHNSLDEREKFETGERRPS
jgi:hypothetical protein